MLCTNDGSFVALCYALHTTQQIKREDFDPIGTHTLPPWPIGVDQMYLYGLPRRVIFIDFPHIRSQRPTKRARNASYYQVLWHAAPWCGCPTFGFHCWPRSLFQAWTVDRVENPGKSECLLGGGDESSFCCLLRFPSFDFSFWHGVTWQGHCIATQLVVVVQSLRQFWKKYWLWRSWGLTIWGCGTHLVEDYPHMQFGYISSL